ncbi:Enoyl-[acyl-carrier-protein] reductase [NADH] (EC, FabV =_ refractory to triclosan [Olavius sp. associated proteobacterium Delta 1]|nr:Enoyl-[acyl-carrier-protein] reductase [NADH] (EC, FabV => refractory to triclosan [Olavius sp. associated proteobacterium Delta 1]
MIINPRIRQNICINAHPVGCAAQVKTQINYVRERGKIEGPQKVLVIGASNGYGLAARIVSAFASDAATIGLAFEKPGSASRTATAGWYNIEAFRHAAETAGRSAWNVNGDAFSEETKSETMAIIKDRLGQVDFLIYSIAAPRRIDPATGEIYSSVIKPIDNPFTAKTVDFLSGVVSEVTAAPASEEQIAHTIKVMGGEDWMLWIDRLLAKNLLARGFQTVAFSYIGSEQTRPLYRDGTIGAAKKDLEQKAADINSMLAAIEGHALISVNKALITRASAVIPAVPLYIALLYRVMKAKNLHEGCIQQIHRLYQDFLFSGDVPKLDARSRVRLDDWEMRPDVQDEVRNLWQQVDQDNLSELADIEGLRAEFLRHHGFGMAGVDYSLDLKPDMF